MKIASKFNQGLKDIPDISIDRFKYKLGADIKINECITLEVIKRGHRTGTVKKMLHAPSMKVICVREEPINSKEARNAIRDWISTWQSKLND